MNIRNSQTRIRIAIMLIVLLTQSILLVAQRKPLTVTVVAIPPFSTQLVDYIQNPVERFTVIIQSQNQKTCQYYLQFKLEQLSPAQRSIQTPSHLPPPVPLTIAGFQSYGPLTKPDVDLNISHLRMDDFLLDGFKLEDLITNLGVLDEGLYQLCVTAYDFNSPAGNPIPLSNPGCATFYLCQSATAPTLVNPGVCNNPALDTLAPTNPLLFSWIHPMMTCGSVANNYEYNIRFVEVMEGQDITSAIDNNPSALEFNNYNSNNLILDTNIMQGIFTGGKRYAWFVKAAVGTGGTPVNFANQGKSPLCSFVYGFTPAPPGTDSIIIPPPEDDKPKIINDTSKSTIAECNAPLIANTQYFSTTLTGKRVTIGFFTMTIETATELPGSGYNGMGYVNWKPYINDTIKIAVEFSGLKINSSYQVFEGVANARFESDMAMYVPESLRNAKSWAEMANGYSTYVGAGNYQGNINQYFNKIGEYNRRLKNLKGTAPYMLPFTLGEAVSNPFADIGIIGMVFTPTTARMNLMAAANIPEANDFLSFVGHGFCFLPENAGNFGEGALFLGEDFQMPLPDGFRFDFKAAKTLGDTATGGTLIKWNSNGFDQARIECDLLFPTTKLLKENSNGDILTGQQVKATFAAHFREWGNWIAMATMDPFQVTSLPGYSFTPSGAWYDNSGTVNPDNIVFLSGYNGIKTNAWKGLYINNLNVKLPTTFKTFNDAGTRTSFAATNVIVDKEGFTGDLIALRMIDLSTGNLGGWSFSLDTIQVKIRNSELQSPAWLSGKILLPISDTALVYRMEMHYHNNELLYQASLRPRDTMNMSLWLAKMHIDPSSGFNFVYAGDFPKFDFTLNGGITIELVNTGSLNLSLKELKFQEIKIANHNNGVAGFTMSIGTWAWASPEKTLGPFPIDFSVPEIIFDNNQQLYGLRFGGGFDLANKAFVCSTKVDVLGEVAMSMTSGPKAQFKKLQLYDITVSGKFDPVSIEGRLQFYYDDPVYGDGVKGRVVASFPIVTVDATAQFGTMKKSGLTSEYSYWFVDASVKFDPPFEAFPFGIGGFIGGVWYNMKSNYSTVVTPSTVYADTTRLSTIAINPGESVSGITYTPAKGFGGVKAGIALTLSNSIGGGNVLNGDVTLACDLNNGDFSSVSLSGNVWAITDYPENKSSLFNATMLMVYDHDNSVFAFNLKARAKFLNTIAVTIPVEFWCKTNENKWYFKLGNPNDRDSMMKAVLVDVDIEILKAKLEATAYFALGNALGNVQLPEIPLEITKLLGGDLNKYRVDPSSFSSSNRKGMLFGAQITGSLNIDLAIIYADFKAIAGFDIALFHDKEFMCEGKSAGYNGWYGIGQIYGYFKGDVGVKIDVWFFEGKASLGSIEAGAVLMGGMPNPTWAYGKVRIRGSVLGGLVKISTSLSMEIGTPCYPDESSNPLDKIRILELTNPGYETVADARDNPPESIFIDPRVVTNVPLSGAVENLVKIALPPTKKQPNGSYRNYKFFIKDIYIYEGNSTTVPDNAPAIPITWANANSDFYTANISRNDALKPHTYYRIVVRATGRVFENGNWTNPLIQGERNEHIETLITFFRTGPAPDYIPKENLVFSMPLNRQRNFYTREYVQCGILLGESQNYLFNNSSKRVELWVRSLDNQYSKKLSVTVAGKAIYYNMPVDMPKNQLFNLALIRIDLEGEQKFMNALAQENRKQILTSLADGKKMEILASMKIDKPQTPSEKITQAGLNGTLTTTQQAGKAGGGNLIQTTQTLNPALVNATLTGGSSGSTNPQILTPGTTSGTLAVTTGLTTNASTPGAGSIAGKVAGVSLTGGGTTFDQQVLANWNEITSAYINTYKYDTADYRKMESVYKAEFGFIDTLVTIYFRTSQYDYISDKLAAAGAMKATGANDFKTNPNCPLLLRSQNKIEAFERMEFLEYMYTCSIHENKYGSPIPPLIFPNEAYDPSLNDHDAWRVKVFDMLHWVFDECERANFKIKETWVTAPDVLYANFRGKELMTYGYRNVPDFYPQNSVHTNVMASMDYAPAITNEEIQLKRITNQYTSYITYNASVTRQKIYTDFTTSQAFLQAYKTSAAHWSSGDAQGRNRKAKQCVQEGWKIMAYSPDYNNWVSLPYYQMVQFWEDKLNTVHKKLIGNNPTDYINIPMPPLNYNGRRVWVQKISLENPTNGKWNYNHAFILNILYNP